MKSDSEHEEDERMYVDMHDDSFTAPVSRAVHFHTEPPRRPKTPPVYDSRSAYTSRDTDDSSALDDSESGFASKYKHGFSVSVMDVLLFQLLLG